MPTPTLAPVPILERLYDDVRVGLLRSPWIRWLTSVKAGVDAAAQKVGGASLTAQGAAISATAIPALSLTAGLYRVSYYARITQAATTSSSLTPTIAWTDGGVAMSQAGAAITGNTTATEQNDTFVVRIDNATAVNYSTAYASVGATSMQYSLDVRLEYVP